MSVKAGFLVKAFALVAIGGSTLFALGAAEHNLHKQELARVDSSARGVRQQSETAELLSRLGIHLNNY